MQQQYSLVPVVSVRAPEPPPACGASISRERRDELEGWIVARALRSAEGSPWNDVNLVRNMFYLWETGLSTSRMGRELHKSKNAIVSMIHRLLTAGCPLTVRPSPILRNGPERRQRPTRASRQELARQIVTQIPPVVPASSVAPVPTPALISIRADDLRAMSVMQQPCRHHKSIECCFPIGEPFQRSFRFCGEPSVPGRPYCEDHCAIAYVRTEDLREQDLHEEAA